MADTSPRSHESASPSRVERGVTAEERVAFLRAELEVSRDKMRQAILQYEIGHITQYALGAEASAVREYLTAYNLVPQFRPPLIALIQIFERRRSMKNLARLYDAEARSATTAEHAASALADRAGLTADQGDAEDARDLLISAFSQAPTASDLALLLEHAHLTAGDEAAALTVTESRADLTEDPVLATLLRIEVAQKKRLAGDHDGAIAMLRRAVTDAAARWRVLAELETAAREDGRWPEVIVALEGRAKLAALEARGEGHEQGSGAFALNRFEDQAAAAATAAQLYGEAARLRTHKLGDPAGAKHDYDVALSLRPGDPVLLYESMLACDLAGDLDGAAAAATALLERVDSSEASALHFRIAERAQAIGDVATAQSILSSANRDDPSSAVVAAMYTDLVRGSGAATAVTALEASVTEGDALAQRLWEAATISARNLRDAARARDLYERAAGAASDPAAIRREAFASALALGDAVGARQHLEALLALPLDADEKSALHRERIELLGIVLDDAAATVAALREALASPECASWAADLARVHGASHHDYALLSDAHQVLAAHAADAETAAAHMCAEARAHARAGQPDAAIAALRKALEKSPSHPYAVALLEELLRTSGKAEELVAFLREAAEKADAPGALSTQLLLAGGAAEAADDVERAIKAYEEAAERDPAGIAAPLALKRIAQRLKRPELLDRALRSLSEHEIAANEPGRHTLALAVHHDLAGELANAETALRAALADPSVSLAAAVDLALLPASVGAARLDGLLRVLEHAPEEARPGLLRETIAVALRENNRETAERLLGELNAVAPRDRWAPIAQLRRLGGEAEHASERADAWMALARSTDDPEVSAELLLHGLRIQSLGVSEDTSDDAVIVAHEVLSTAPESLAAAVAVDESLSAGDDPDGRADALGSLRDHAGSDMRLALDSAYGRALAAAGRSQSALEVLLRVAATEPDDLASWEAIRVCARDCEAWEPLVEACDRLAHLVGDDELVMMLLEESAATLMDELEQDARAERRLRRVLAIDARRPIAYGRLHDLLAQRGDDKGLLELVGRRIDLVDNPEELTKLFYEQARLLRSLGSREEALAALDNLLILEAQHLGGLALLVELQVQNENWQGAVEALRTLAGAEDVPSSQRRIARLGAADFLQSKLQDPAGALGELLALHDAGLADLEIYERAATVADELGHYDTAVRMLAAAVAQSSTPNAIASLERRAGAILLKAGVRDQAVAAYERALSAHPTDLQSASALAELYEGDERSELSRRFEQSVRDVLNTKPTDPGVLRRLLRAAEWRADAALAYAALAALTTLGHADDEERAAFDQAAAATRRPTGTLGTDLSAVRFGVDGAPPLTLARALSESVAQIYQLDPTGFSLAKGDLLTTSNALSDELSDLCRIFGLPTPLVYVGGDDPHRIDVLPYHHKEGPALVVGAEVKSPLTAEQRFVVGRHAFGLQMGVAPFLRRGATEIATILFAGAAAAERPLPAGEGRAGLAETTRRLQKAMPRRLRKELPEIIAAFADGGRGFEPWARHIAHSAMRAGMLAANELEVGLRVVMGAAPVEAAEVLASPEATELLLFWLSPELLHARTQVGLGS